MGAYVLIYVGGEQPQSEADGQADMERWMAWFGTLGDAVIDAGNPFGPSASIRPDGSRADGTTSGATGYSILRADDLEGALALASGCPHLTANGTIEVHEVFEIV